MEIEHPFDCLKLTTDIFLASSPQERHSRAGKGEKKTTEITEEVEWLCYDTWVQIPGFSNWRGQVIDGL